MENRNIPLFKVFMSPDVEDSVPEVLMSGYIGQGPKVDEFERAISGLVGSPYVNAVNSATSGLQLALHMLKDGSGRDEILTTPLTCTATNFPILAEGLKIKWVDLDPRTCNVDLQDLRRKIGPKTLAIMVVHWGGYPVDLDELTKIQLECESLYGHYPYVIEDCAHALGSTYDGQPIGSYGNFCVFSFQAIKHLTTGDGGALICPTDAMHRRAKLLRWYGLDRTSSADFRCEQNIEEWGFKFHMNDIAASIGLANLPYVSDNIKKHMENSEYLSKALWRYATATPETCRKSKSSAWIFTVLVDRRDDFMRMLKTKGIGVSRVHDRNDKHECLKEFRTPLPNTDYVCSRLACIPCGWWVTKEDLEYIVDCIKGGW